MNRFTTLILLASIFPNAILAQHTLSATLPHYRFRFESAQLLTAENCFYSRFTVFNRRTGAVVQRATFVTDDATSLECRFPADIMLKSTDPNNNGHFDAFVLSFSSATNQIYDLWLFQASTGKFRKVLTGLFNPSVNRLRREIRSTHQMGLGSSEQNLYRHRNGSFYLYEITTRERNNLAGNTRVVVKRLVNGQMRIVRQFVEPDQP